MQALYVLGTATISGNQRLAIVVRAGDSPIAAKAVKLLSTNGKISSPSNDSVEPN